MGNGETQWTDDELRDWYRDNVQHKPGSDYDVIHELFDNEFKPSKSRDHTASDDAADEAAVHGWFDLSEQETYPDRATGISDDLRLLNQHLQNEARQEEGMSNVAEVTGRLLGWRDDTANLPLDRATVAALRRAAEAWAEWKQDNEPAGESVLGELSPITTPAGVFDPRDPIDAAAAEADAIVDEVATPQDEGVTVELSPPSVIASTPADEGTDVSPPDQPSHDPGSGGAGPGGPGLGQLPAWVWAVVVLVFGAAAFAFCGGGGDGALDDGSSGHKVSFEEFLDLADTVCATAGIDYTSLIGAVLALPQETHEQLNDRAVAHLDLMNTLRPDLMDPIDTINVRPGEEDNRSEGFMEPLRTITIGQHRASIPANEAHALNLEEKKAEYAEQLDALEAGRQALVTFSQQHDMTACAATFG